jgi:hypothetical protein
MRKFYFYISDFVYDDYICALPKDMWHDMWCAIFLTFLKTKCCLDELCQQDIIWVSRSPFRSGAEYVFFGYLKCFALQISFILYCFKAI